METFRKLDKCVQVPDTELTYGKSHCIYRQMVNHHTWCSNTSSILQVTFSLLIVFFALQKHFSSIYFYLSNFSFLVVLLVSYPEYHCKGECQNFPLCFLRSFIVQGLMIKYLILFLVDFCVYLVFSALFVRGNSIQHKGLIPRTYKNTYNFIAPSQITQLKNG